MAETISNILEDWLKKTPAFFVYRRDGDVFTIREALSDKEIRLPGAHLMAHEIRLHLPTQTEYLVLMRDDGVQIVLCFAGIAFAPDFTSTGPLQDAPPVGSMRDYSTLRQNLQSLIADERSAEALVVFNVLISILDGARRIGISVSSEEEELNRTLTEFENKRKLASCQPMQQIKKSGE